MARKMLNDGEPDLKKGEEQGKVYDFDLFIIGAGSGGVRAARFSSNFGAKVRNYYLLTHFFFFFFLIDDLDLFRFVYLNFSIGA